MSAYTGANMCPQCGWLFDLTHEPDRLIPEHWHADVKCEGSQQNPRCPESDARPLWNGERNPWFSGGVS